MSLRLTPPVLVTAYDFLRTTNPFSAWKLPTSDVIDFKIIKDSGYVGWYDIVDDVHTIAISKSLNGHMMTFIMTMAHEMIHLHQELAGSASPKSNHNIEYYRLARLVCKYHGYDFKAFK